MQSVQTRTIFILAKEKYGSIARAGVAWGLHPNTAYRAALGYRVSKHTREIIEKDLGLPMETLMRPIVDVLLESRAA